MPLVFQVLDGGPVIITGHILVRPAGDKYGAGFIHHDAGGHINIAVGGVVDHLPVQAAVRGAVAGCVEILGAAKGIGDPGHVNIPTAVNSQPARFIRKNPGTGSIRMVPYFAAVCTCILGRINISVCTVTLVTGNDHITVTIKRDIGTMVIA